VRTTVKATIEVEIARPREAVWEFLADPATSPRWIEEFVESHAVSEGSPGVGSDVSYTIEPGPRSGTFELTEWEPPRWMAWAGPPLHMMGGGGAPRGSFELAETGPGATKLTATFCPELTGLPVLLKPYLRRWLVRQRRADVVKLKAILESDDG